MMMFAEGFLKEFLHPKNPASLQCLKSLHQDLGDGDSQGNVTQALISQLNETLFPGFQLPF